MDARVGEPNGKNRTGNSYIETRMLHTYVGQSSHELFSKRDGFITYYYEFCQTQTT